MTRRHMIRHLEQWLGGRRLVWWGIRAEDAAPLECLPQFGSAYAIIGTPPSGTTGLVLERLTGERVDLAVWDLDTHVSEPSARILHLYLLQDLSRPTALITYRPTRFLDALAQASKHTCQYLGLHAERQSRFENKPWVETDLTRAGLRGIPWTYTLEPETIARLAERGPVVVRKSRTNSGAGLSLVSDPDEVAPTYSHSLPEPVAVSPHFPEALSVNVGAVVWADGTTVHHASVQLIGDPLCVSRPFGYFGNDFGLIKQLDWRLIDEIEQSTRTAATWLREHGYRGAFGVDFLVHEGRVYFVEINPRFQGSSQISSELAADADEPCIYLDHLAAWMGLPAPSRPAKLSDRVRDQESRSVVFVHWTAGGEVRVDDRLLIASIGLQSPSTRVDMLPPIGLVMHHESILARLSVSQSVTVTGTLLAPEWQELIRERLGDPSRFGTVLKP